ncbi:MAG: phosphoribosylanthranilate isomerase [Brevundimonas sp.]|uniref:phosphoribosylanthranilate isomerase n=1 Tax=Brevundimonas sp. TaxID=1871086 RepID=UPI0040333038
MTRVKICGLSTPETLEAALTAGADYVGFVMLPASPRFVAPNVARRLVDQARGRAKTVLLFADTPRLDMDRLVHDIQPDLIQLHGRETVAEILDARNDYALPVIRAVGVGSAADLDGLDEIEAAADHLLLDARPPRGADRTGGHGLAFDWSLLAGRAFNKPWFLAGGLNPENVADAVQATGAPMVDVSSGVETAPGVKDAGRIAAFIQAVRRT